MSVVGGVSVCALLRPALTAVVFHLGATSGEWPLLTAARCDGNYWLMLWLSVMNVVFTG